MDEPGRPGLQQVEMTDRQTLRSACAEMTAYIAVLLTKNTFDPNYVAEAGDVIQGWSISESHEGEFLLTNQLHLARPIGEHKNALNTSSATYSAHFATGDYDDCFDAILQAYVGFIAWNQDVPTRRAWFAPPSGHIRILEPLAKMGFLECDAGQMRWTDRAGHFMLCAAAWNSNFQCNLEVREWEREKEARQIIKSLPSDLVFLAMNDPKAAFWKLHERLGHDSTFEKPEKLLVERVIELIQAKKSGTGRDC